ncbi:MAG: 4-hydroxythreonine-4-phosphate dehydrogenase PdxA [Flavobacteriales bacterium]|jgi:4-hydroxythreonine-4-phosphate dehydrogenase|nr:4-hydroxythreonine-4-phosphate dehydrogenase PdxA [Flavobacteriales bacterium]MBK6893090.1 4-hydroxythreonine-4-phosphate dehydrogenase PdxA [Flavobacteriales bacterium]MBK7249190.1 4-hydroxythreonine-4-phosphate dehydrogenase PdxA [Flavobacteriales bacterium]MBK7285747.1 4-hydroxythreonine-4-phosphate dehydrogenase PdxA [Flavobacteriales bacterium]MBK9599785.1 4-hydroxythreonine-4-phosphate dehydrogenase PdxA [Flavobacteriales bacterium]
MIEGPVRVGISCGDLNGIGLEVVLKTFEDPRMLLELTPVLYCGARAVSFHRKALGGMEQMQINGIADAQDAIPKKLNVVHAWEEEAPIELGVPSGKAASFAIQSLEAAAQDLSSGKVDVLVTAPIDKHSMEMAGFGFPGHTEFLAHMAGGDAEVLMLLVSENLRVGTVTGHIPLKSVAESITVERIMVKARLMHQSLERDFGITGPKIAILGLNPHAGDGGTLGSEDKERILPAVRKLNEEGIIAMGPYPADGFFGNGSYKHFDGVLAMYHDQGLAPFKALSFGHGVNYTAGLPVVRTSPDHGTGLDIAGKGIADEGSFRHAVWLACDILRNREAYKAMTANPLQAQKREKGRRDE